MQRILNRLMAFSSHRWFGFLLIVMAAILVIFLPTFIGGLHASGDLVVYLGFADEFRAAIASGDFFPGWANDNRGFGSVGIRFYPPLAPYMLALIDMVAGSMYDSIWAYFFIWRIVGCTGVYLFVKDWGTAVQASAAAMLYAIIPYPLAEIYQFSLFAEFAGASLIPFCFLFVTRICLGREWINVPYLAVSCSLLVLAHIPTTIITIISLFIYALLIIEWRNVKKIVLQLGTAAVVTLINTAFYWVNVVTEIEWVAHYRDEYSTGMAGFERWVFPHSLIRWGDVPYYYSPVYRNMDAIIVLTVLALAPFLALWVTNRGGQKIKSWRIVSAATVTGLIGFFMMSWPSTFIWSGLTLLQKIQFPWRWLTVLSVLATVSFVFSVPRLSQRLPTYKTLIAFGVAGLIGLMIAFDIRQSFARPNRFPRSDEFWAAGYSPNGASSPAWWPVWANAKAFELSEQVAAGERSVEIGTWESKERRFRIGAGSSTSVRVATFYYPHWQATVNGRRVEVGKDEHGAILIPVGPEGSEVTLGFEEPVLQRASKWLSSLSWCFSGLLVLLGFRQRKKSASYDSNSK